MSSEIAMVAFVFLLLSLAGLVILLVRNTFARRKAEAELRQCRNHLEERGRSQALELERRAAALQQETVRREQAEAALRLSETRLRQIIDLLPHRIFVKSRDGRFIVANQAMAEVHHCTPEEMPGKRHADLEGLELEYAQHERNDRKVLESGRPLFIPEETLTAPDGTTRTFQVSRLPYIFSGSDESAVLVIAIELTELRRAKENFAQEELLLRTVINNLPDYIYVKDAAGRFILDNLAYARSIGLTDPDDLIGKAEAEIIPQQIQEQHHAEDLALIQSGQPLFNHENWLIRPDGNKQWLLSTKIPLRDTHGRIIGMIGLSRDNTERKLAEESHQQHTRELNLINHMGNLLQACKTEEDAYSIMGSVCKLLFPSDAGYLSMMSPSRTELKIVVCWGDVEPEMKVFGVSDCWACRLDTTHYIEHPETGLLCSHLEVFPEQGYLCALISSSEEILGIFHLRFGVFDTAYTDEDRKRLKDARRMIVNRVVRHFALFIVNLRLRETLKREAIRDPLTGLYNRRHMEASLEREALRAERLHTPVGLIMIDVDHFKHFNDAYGHDTGDRVLQELGNVLKSSIRGEDIACRFGGEEFLLILPDTTPEQVKLRAEEIRKKVRALRIPYQAIELTITISAGVSILPHHGPGIEDAFKAADAALYQAKADGRDRVVLASF